MNAYFARQCITRFQQSPGLALHSMGAAMGELTSRSPIPPSKGTRAKATGKDCSKSAARTPASRGELNAKVQGVHQLGITTPETNTTRKHLTGHESDTPFVLSDMVNRRPGLKEFHSLEKAHTASPPRIDLRYLEITDERDPSESLEK